MPLRLIELIVKEEESGKIQEFLKEQKVLQHREIHLQNGEVFVRILMDAEKNEKILDLLEKQYANTEENRVIILPVKATIPRIKQEEKESEDSKRINREELYEDIKSAAQCSRSYLVMTILSTIVAVIGLHQNSMVVIIGAMVIAPTIGPNMALSLSTTLGDLPLLRNAFLTTLIGIVIAVILSAAIGAIIPTIPLGSEILSRTSVNFGDITVALVSGCAGALAFTTGVSAILIGVMVAVALLPSLAAFGMLLGAGQTTYALGALSLFLINMICVNLSGVITFLLQGIHPNTWWEKKIAKKASLISISLWFLLLMALITLILQNR